MTAEPARCDPDELARLRDACFALARHLRVDHDDWRGGNATQQHVWHLAHHGVPLTIRDPHPITARDDQR